MQNFGRPTIYSFVNTSFGPQPDNTLNASYVNDVQYIPVALDNMSQVSTITPIITPLTTPNMNENQDFNIQEMAPYCTLQPMQDYQQAPPQPSHPFSLTHSQKVDIMSEYSFFYAPPNDCQMYHINCKEISFNFESVSQLISDIDNNCVQSNYVFYHEQPEIRKIYQVTCEMVSQTLLFQFLNKNVYNIQSMKCEHHQQEFSKRHQENLKSHLEKDLVHYLIPKNTSEDNYINESMINSNTYVLDQFYTSQ